jgi:hypothetical protein
VKWAQRISIAILAVVAVLFIAFTSSKIAWDYRSHLQKRTMVNIRDAAIRHERGQPIGLLVDEWGTPMRVRTRGPHISIRAAMSDRTFESTMPHPATYEPGDDIVFLDGHFWQFPGGWRGFGPPPAPGPDPTLGPCSSCHRGRVEKR